jgi:hypothetical protein
MRGLVCYFLLLVCGGAAAQTISDTELQVGYCLGVVTSEAEVKAEELKAEASNPMLGMLDQGMLRHIRERQKRFDDYLTAKGFARDRRPEALRIASERGKNNVATCEAALEQEFYKECPERCDRIYGQATDASLDCFDRCPSPNSCILVWKCFGDFLPF